MSSEEEENNEVGTSDNETIGEPESSDDEPADNGEADNGEADNGEADSKRADSVDDSGMEVNYVEDSATEGIAATALLDKMRMNHLTFLEKYTQFMARPCLSEARRGTWLGLYNELKGMFKDYLAEK